MCELIGLWLYHFPAVDIRKLSMGDDCGSYRLEFEIFARAGRASVAAVLVVDFSIVSLYGPFVKLRVADAKVGGRMMSISAPGCLHTVSFDLFILLSSRWLEVMGLTQPL